MKTLRDRFKAFTLIETLMATVIATILAGSITSFFLSMVMGKQDFLEKQELEYNSSFVIQRIQSEIKESQSINEETSTFDISPGILSLSKSNPLDDPTTISTDNGQLLLTRGSQNPLALTTDKVLVNDLTFNFQSPNNSPGILSGTLTLETIDTNSQSKTENFSISLRVNNP
ncbi:MAG: type II secretion system protein [Candidatus Gracilibacteria bacterium]|nr:type II secretion system protein [bacterium]MDZ4217197.1 type II secretion system protein [Candidatus Gracilibacteria bacterium]